MANSDCIKTLQLSEGGMPSLLFHPEDLPNARSQSESKLPYKNRTISPEHSLLKLLCLLFTSLYYWSLKW